MRAAAVWPVLAASLLAACGGGSHGTTTVTATVASGITASPPAATAPTTAVAPPAGTTTAPATVTVSPSAPLDAGALGAVTNAATAFDAAVAGLDQATASCAATGDCAAAQEIAGRTRAAHTALALAVADADRDVLRGSGCDAAIGGLLDAVHRFRGRLEDVLARFGDANARRLTDARTRLDTSVAAVVAACPSAG